MPTIEHNLQLKHGNKFNRIHTKCRRPTEKRLVYLLKWRIWRKKSKKKKLYNQRKYKYNKILPYTLKRNAHIWCHVVVHLVGCAIFGLRSSPNRHRVKQAAHTSTADRTHQQWWFASYVGLSVLLAFANGIPLSEIIWAVFVGLGSHTNTWANSKLRWMCEMWVYVSCVSAKKKKKRRNGELFYKHWAFNSIQFGHRRNSNTSWINI